MSNFRMTRGTTAQRTALTLSEGALVYDTDLDQVFVGDGTTAGGVLICPGGGPPPTPQEHFTFTLNPTQITQASSGSTTVTATFGVSGAGFTYVGYTGLAVSGPTTITLNDRAGTDTTSQFNIPNNVAGTYRVTAFIESNNSSGDSQPRHPVSGSIHVNAQWYASVLTAAPTDLSGLTARGAYHSGVSQQLTGIANGRMYVALPTGVTPRFRSGIVDVAATQITSGWTPTTHTLWDLGRLVSGTFTVEVTS